MVCVLFLLLSPDTSMTVPPDAAYGVVAISSHAGNLGSHGGNFPFCAVELARLLASGNTRTWHLCPFTVQAV